MKTLLLIILCFVASNTIAQLAYIPDDNFETYLETTYPACATGGIDNFVIAEGVLSSAGMIPTFIVLTGGVSDLTGIESLTNVGVIQLINCPSLSSIDLSNVNVGNININDPDNINEGMQLLVQNCPNVTEITVPQGYLKSVSIVGNMFSLNSVNFNNSNVQRGVIGGDNSQAPNWKFVDLSMISSVELGYTNVYGFGPNFDCILMDNGGYLNLTTVNIQGNGNTCVQIEDPAYAINAWPFTASSVQFNSQCSGCTTNLEQIELESKIVLRVTDLLGRETIPTPNTPLIYIYSDGSTERVFNVQ